MNEIIYAFILTGISGLSTLIGSLLVFFVPNNNKGIICSLAFTGGVMLTISLFNLIPESLKFFLNNYNLFLSVLWLLIFINLGIIISISINKYLPENKAKSELYRVGVITTIAMFIHNIPEGMATFIATIDNYKLGLALVVTIALHNIPEGICISMPIYYSSNNKKKAILYTLISGMSEVVGAVIAFLIINIFDYHNIMGVLFAIISGIMINISLYELLPESFKHNNFRLTFISFIIGFLVINILNIFI